MAIESIGLGDGILNEWTAQKSAWETEVLRQGVPPQGSPVPSRMRKDILCPYEASNTKGKRYFLSTVLSPTDYDAAATQKEILASLQKRATDDAEKGHGLYDVIREGIELQELQYVRKFLFVA